MTPTVIADSEEREKPRRSLKPVKNARALEKFRTQIILNLKFENNGYQNKNSFETRSN